jgi:uncharacterized protein
MKPRLSMITLGVADLELSTRFYRDGLGLPADTQFPGVTFLHLEGAWLSLFPLQDLADDANLIATEQVNQFSGFTLAHNVASKEEVKQVFQLALKAGATPLKEPQDAPWGGFHAHFSDPDDYVWEIAWNPQFDLTFQGS